MYYVSLLTEIEGGNNLLNNFSCDCLAKAANPLQLLVEVALWYVLEHGVDVILVVEVCVQFGNVWVGRKPILYLQLFFHLLVEVVVVQ